MMPLGRPTLNLPTSVDGSRNGPLTPLSAASSFSISPVLAQWSDEMDKQDRKRAEKAVKRPDETKTIEKYTHPFIESSPPKASNPSEYLPAFDVLRSSAPFYTAASPVESQPAIISRTPNIQTFSSDFSGYAPTPPLDHHSIMTLIESLNIKDPKEVNNKPNENPVRSQTPPPISQPNPVYTPAPAKPAASAPVPAPAKPEPEKKEVQENYYHMEGRGGGGGGRRPKKNAAKRHLLFEKVLELLEDPKINPYSGSVPIERIQNIVRSNYEQLYFDVVGTRHNSWREFIEFFTGYFCLIQVDNKWRIRLKKHENWEEGDKKQREASRASDSKLAAVLEEFLRDREGQCCTVDDFVSHPECKDSSGPVLRGDLVRFVKRHNDKFSYEKEGFRILLVTNSSPPSPTDEKPAAS